MIQDSKNVWMCVCAETKDVEKGLFPVEKSISYTRAGSIESFIENSSKNWRWWKRKGWKCVRVDVSFKEVIHDRA